MSQEAINYVREHVQALATWALTVMVRENYDQQYLLEDLIDQLDVLAAELSTLDGKAGVRPTVLQVGGRGYGPAGELR